MRPVVLMFVVVQHVGRVASCGRGEARTKHVCVEEQHVCNS